MVTSSAVGRAALPDSEARHLDYAHKRRLGEILDVNDAWKDFMARIKMPHDPSSPRFTSEDIQILDRARKTEGFDSGFEILLDEWGTMGRKRPTVRDVLDLCLQVEAYTAASYIQSDILKCDEAISPPSAILDTIEFTSRSVAVNADTIVGQKGDGNDVTSAEHTNSTAVVGAAAAAPSTPSDRLACPDVADEEFDALLEADLESLSLAAAASEDSEQENSDFLSHPRPPENTLLTHRVSYAYLAKITDNFSPSRFIGKGGFATVYEGITARSRARIAVKKLKSNASGVDGGGNGGENGGGGGGHFDPEVMMQQLNYEVDQLPRLRHPNIIELLGYSNDEQQCCLLYPLLPGGTLEKRLRRNSSAFPLSAVQRTDVALGVARGLHFLHTRPKCMIHRDIKSSNILLDHNHLPKIADFGLLRYAVTGDSESVTFTAAVKGTAAYMPPEAINCDVSAKWDTWSYGVVILELITGLPVMDRNREDHDLTTHVKNLAEETDFSVNDILDPLCSWTADCGASGGVATKLYDIADKCLKRNKRTRPSMADVIAMIQT